MNKCNQCQNFGLCFDRINYLPVDFIEGNKKAPIWIIGLNPKKPNEEEINTYRNESKNDLLMRFKKSFHSYFNDFKKVNPKIYEGLITGNVAHTDLVKCWSDDWNYKNSKEIIKNCLPYLKEQLNEHNNTLKMIVCNGAQVSEYIKKIIPIESTEEIKPTSYVGLLNGKKIIIVLSGFIGRIDDYSKRRLGEEIQMLINKYKIDL